MFNKILLEEAEKKCGSLWIGGADETMIANLSEDLNVDLPQSYKIFLKEYGEGGVGFYIFGIGSKEFSSAKHYTLIFREKKSINLKWIVIAFVRTNWEEYLVCLDTSRMNKNECPVIKYDLIDEEEEDFKENFYEYFNYKVESAYDEL